jgi:hypothetical protein
MSVYPAWMEKRCARTIIVEIPVPGPPGSGGGNGGGSGGGGASIPIQRPLPKVRIKKVVVLDDYENINVTVLKVIDLSLNIGGT